MGLHRGTADGWAGEVEASVEGVWSFEEFWFQLGEVIGIEQGSVDPKTSLRDDLEFDSLHMAELVVFMDELGCELPEDLIPVLEDAADLYDHYVTRITAEPHRGAP